MSALLKSANKIIKYLEQYKFPDFDLVREIKWFMKKSPDALYDEGASFIANSGKNFGPLSSDVNSVGSFVIEDYTSQNDVVQLYDTIYIVNGYSVFEEPRVCGIKLLFTPLSGEPSIDDEFSLYYYNDPNEISVTYDPTTLYNVVYGQQDNQTTFSVRDLQIVNIDGINYYEYSEGVTDLVNAYNNVYSINNDTITTLVNLYTAVRLMQPYPHSNSGLGAWNIKIFFYYV